MMKMVSWHVENKIILVVNNHELSIEELKQVDTDITQMLDAGNAPVHIIYKAGNFKTPTDISQVRNSLTFLQHPAIGWIVTVNTNRLINFISLVVTNLSKINLKTASDITEAESILAKIDASIAR